ncbi:MAG: MFS transporter [Gammaproteobacteria bacterium]|nr:MFS transporter [Gammaproteobacteria bacterium]
MKEYLELIRQRPGFRNLWLASLVSLLGDWFNTIASMMIVNRYTETDLAISWILIARTLPRFVIGPVAGVVADRVNRKLVMVVTDLLRAGIVLSFLFVDRPERVWMIYFLTTLQFVMASFFEPASSAILPGLVEGRKELMSANVLRSITWSVMLTMGAALGGVFAGIFGARAALVADSLTFILSAFLVMNISYHNIEGVKEKIAGGYSQLVEGFKYVLDQPRIAVLALIKTFGQIGSVDILIAVFAEQYFPYGKEGATSLGIMFGAAGIGAVLGPMIANRYTKGDVGALRSAIQYGYLLVPIGWVLIGWSPNLWVVSLGVMVRLMGGSINWTYSNVLIQTEVEDRILGRVFALDLGMFTLASSASIFLTGYLLDTLEYTARDMGWFFMAGSVIPVIFWWVYQLRISRTPIEEEVRS